MFGNTDVMMCPQPYTLNLPWEDQAVSRPGASKFNEETKTENSRSPTAVCKSGSGHVFLLSHPNHFGV